MERLLAFLKDPAWWFATVLVGILVSVLAAFLKDALSAFLSLYTVEVLDCIDESLYILASDVGGRQ